MGTQWGALAHGRGQSNSSGLDVYGSLPLASVVLRPPTVTLEPAELVRIRGEAARIVCSASDIEIDFEVILQRGNTKVSPRGDSRVMSAHLPTTSDPAGWSPRPHHKLALWAEGAVQVQRGEWTHWGLTGSQ